MKHNSPVAKVIITCAITGAETTKTQNPALPCTPEEQAIAARDCLAAGASVIHLHVRDAQGKPSQALEDFRAATNAIMAAAPKIILQYSTGGAVGEPIARRIAPLSLKPEMASLNVGSINFGDEVFTNLPKDIEALALEMQKLAIKPEIEVYDIGMLEYGVSLVKKGLINSPAHFQFVLGLKTGIQATRENLEFMIKKLPADATFAVAGIGRAQLEMAEIAIALGGHVRCGFEDNIYLAKGVLAPSNAALVEKVAEACLRQGRAIASPEEARKILNLN